MEFKCEMCNYASHDKFNYKRHEKSKKHIEKVNDIPKLSRNYPETIIKLSNENKFKCAFCNNEFSNSGNLVRHKISCLEKKQLIDEFNCKLDDQIKINQQKDEIIKQKDESLSILKSEVAHLKLIVNNSGSIVKTSVSTMAYVIKNFSGAPALESVKDYSAIHFEQDNIGFIENLIHESDHNKLHIYFGDFIIKTYKKENPSDQAIWNSDTSRLTYLIREIIENNKVDWKVDKKGIKTTKFIIEPILEYVNQQIRNYVENFDIDYHNDSVRIAENKMMKLKSATEIIQNIEDKVLSDDILKYVAPHFYLNKADELN